MNEINDSIEKPYILNALRSGSVEANYILVPTLLKGLLHFEDYLDITEDDHVLITAPSGTGKSIFIRDAIEREKVLGRPEPVTLDCTIFIGADPNMAKSQLFGHMKDSFTGANADKKGIIEERCTQKRLFILDEVGELPQEVQGALLVYVETGEYWPVGATEANVTDKDKRPRIIAATNRGSQIREELSNRFYKFTIPPLHQRREDILPLLAQMEPDVFRSLSSIDILLLLGHHWPGNMRELKQVSKELLLLIRGRSDSEANLPLFLDMNSYNSEINIRGWDMFVQHLKEAEINVLSVNKMLKVYDLQIPMNWRNPDEDKNVTHPFCNFRASAIIQDEFGVLQDSCIKKIHKINFGFKGVFCSFLGLSEKYSGPVFEQRMQRSFRSAWQNTAETEPGLTMVEISQKVNAYLMKKGSAKKPALMDFSFEELLKEYHKQLLKKNSENPILTDFSYGDLLKEYHKQLLYKTGGNKAQASRLAGENENTFKDRLKKYGSS